MDGSLKFLNLWT